MNEREPLLYNGSAPRQGKRYFTLSDARRALPYVRRIAADIQTTQAERLVLHARLEAAAGGGGSAEPLRKLQSELDRLTTRLEHLIGELQMVGVDLKDPARGLLDFPALHEGHEILLCWKAGEETIAWWHEVDTGYTGRRPVEELHDHM